jgi:hypothetical protein
MSLRATPLCLWVVIGFVVVVTAVHGYWTDRWNPVSQEESLGELVAIPRQIGEWTGVDVDVPQPTEKEAATLVRRYTHASSEERSVLMVLTRGLPGIASVHTPDLCYPGGGYHLVTSIDRKFLSTPDGTQGEFYTAVFQKSKLGEVQRLNINWGWTTNGHWEAPDYPALEIRRRSPTLQALHRLARRRERNRPRRTEPRLHRRIARGNQPNLLPPRRAARLNHPAFSRRQAPSKASCHLSGRDGQGRANVSCGRPVPHAYRWHAATPPVDERTASLHNATSRGISANRMGLLGCSQSTANSTAQSRSIPRWGRMRC